MQTCVTLRTLYSSLSDLKNREIVFELAKVYPRGLWVSRVAEAIHLKWTATKRRIHMLAQEGLLRKLPGREDRKEVLYALASRTLFEYDVLETLFKSAQTEHEGSTRLADGLKRSFQLHGIPVDERKLASIAVLTGEFVKRGYVDELRDQVFSPRLQLHNIKSEDVAVFFIRAFLKNKLYLNRFSRQTPSGLSESEIRALFLGLKKQLMNARTLPS